MQLKPFLLDAWLDQYEHDIEFNLAASTGPNWTVNDILALADDETRHRFLKPQSGLRPPAGADSLREAIAEMQGVPVEAVQIVTGASRSSRRPDVASPPSPAPNVIIRSLDSRRSRRSPNHSASKPASITCAVKAASASIPTKSSASPTPRPKLILVNSPHNPRAPQSAMQKLEALHDFNRPSAESSSSATRSTILSTTEGQRNRRPPAHATVIADLSKAFSIAGVRTGWMIEHDAKRRQQYWTARAYFSICNSTTGEILSEIAIRKHDVVLGKTQESRHPEPQAPRSLHGGSSATYSAGFRRKWHDRVPVARERRATEPGKRPSILPGRHRARNPTRSGDCFDVPSHFRLGFAAAGDNLPKALDRFGAFVKSWQPSWSQHDGCSMIETCCDAIKAYKSLLSRPKRRDLPFC